MICSIITIPYKYNYCILFTGLPYMYVTINYNMYSICMHNTTGSKSIPLLCTHVYSYMFSIVHPPRSMVHMENNIDIMLIILSILTQTKSKVYHEINEIHKRYLQIRMSKFLDVNCKLLQHILQGDNNLPPHV